MSGPLREEIRAAYVAYHYPPLGGAGTQRSLKFTVNLPAFGVVPTVVTGPGTSRGRWTPHDDSLVDELGSAIDIHRVPGPEPLSSSSGWAGRRRRWLLADSEWDRWWRSGLYRTLTSLDGLDVLYCSMSPFASAEAVARASAHLGVPWIAGLRDPWALDEMMAYPTRLHRAVELRRMRGALASASALIMSAEEAARSVAAACPELADRLVVVPNGYDATDFAAAVVPRDDGKFRIVHTGYLHTEDTSAGVAATLRRLLGGEILGVDVSTRTHQYLLQAVERLIDADPGLADVLEIHLAGVASPADHEAAAGQGFVRFLGYLPHGDSVALIRTADLLFLPMQKLQPGARARIVPGKTYEYLATGRPILAAVPQGDARDIVLAAGTGLVCEPDDVDRMAGIIRAELERWRAGAPGPAADDAFVARFERRALTAVLAEVLQRVSRGSSALLEGPRASS